MLEARSLTKYYEHTAAVRRVSFTIRPGQILGYLGPNGAGKSTTIGMLTTTVLPTAGSARLAGYDVARQPLQVDVDPVQVQQVVLNLLLNALEASAEQPAERRRVVVRTRASGSSAEAMVRDRGCGVSAEGRPHLFEPFYTTKPAGLGMGLSISRSIAESHGGRILMEPADIGSEFRLVLPLARRTRVVPRDVA